MTSVLARLSKWLRPEAPLPWFVVFSTSAPGDEDANALTDVFVRDFGAGVNLLVSRRAVSGAAGNAVSAAPHLSPDGKTVLFTSFASELAEGDYNQTADLFLIWFASAESDFRVLAISRLSGGPVTLVWAAKAGASYRVEYTPALGTPWQALNVSIQTQDSRATAVDDTADGGPARFYRIVQN